MTPVVAGVVWVWLGGTLLLLGFDHVRSVWLVRARTLLGPEETPVFFCGCVLGAAPGSAVPNASVVFVVAVWLLGCGCVLSVA
jgi:hypothetical protein